MRSESTGRVVPKTCKSWLCPTCNVWLRKGAESYFYNGARRAPGEGCALAMLTLTDGADGQLKMAELGTAWDRTRRALDRSAGLAGYALGVELQKRLALHVHALVWLPEEWAGRRLPMHGQAKRDPAQWRYHFRELVPMVRAHGWGQMVDFRRVADEDVAAGYAAKSLSSYATKQANAAFKAAGAKRIRPVRGSQNWAGGRGLAHFQQGECCDPGPWMDVTTVCGGR